MVNHRGYALALLVLAGPSWAGQPSVAKSTAAVSVAPVKAAKPPPNDSVPLEAIRAAQDTGARPAASLEEENARKAADLLQGAQLPLAAHSLRETRAFAARLLATEELIDRPVDFNADFLTEGERARLRDRIRAYVEARVPEMSMVDLHQLLLEDLRMRNDDLERFIKARLWVRGAEFRPGMAPPYFFERYLSGGEIDYLITGEAGLFDDLGF